MLNPINPKSALPIYRQIIDQIRRGVAAGQLAPGDQLPSVRDLAAQLLVNPNTVARVYRDLERDGLLETRRGQGTFISATAEATADSERRRIIAEQLEKVAHDARAFGVSPKDALELFRGILSQARRERRSDERK
ncbi:MAG TPA: GntR family transcriptional regulator [Armatimonadota bacterium]|nr:GntR family transcriptional regulator [Armatimonadota bacterium]